MHFSKVCVFSAHNRCHIAGRSCFITTSHRELVKQNFSLFSPLGSRTRPLGLLQYNVQETLARLETFTEQNFRHIKGLVGQFYTSLLWEFKSRSKTPLNGSRYPGGCILKKIKLESYAILNCSLPNSVVSR